MEKEDDKKVKYLNPDDFGIPTPKPVDPLTRNTLIINMFRKLVKADPSRPLWIRIFAIFLASIIFFLPGIFYLYLCLTNLNESGAIIGLIIGAAATFIGLKIIYENIKSYNKK